MKKLISISILIIIVIFSVNSIAQASEKIASSKSENSSKLKEETSNKQIKGEAKTASEHSTEGGDAAESEEAEHESAWRIPGWQSIFTVLAIFYYFLVSMNILPKIASKEVTDK